MFKLSTFATSFQKTGLIRNKFIRSFTAAFMLILFAFSVTPTIVLHNWFANHKDAVQKLPDNNQDQLAKQVFNCHCDNIVAESPFTKPAVNFQFAAIQIFSLQQETKIVRLPSSTHFHFSLRGPPTAC